jgi:ketosteroid isomerase-like protein
VAHPNDELIERFYSAFASRDGAAMEACYAPNVHFSDPVFPDLRGPQAGAMWRMLTGQAKDLEIELRDHQADATGGTARWIARYTFSATGRRVLNDVSASFRFQDGLIVEHRDSFGFYRWARQALGPAGQLLGWSPVIRASVRRRAAESLAQFQATEP